MTPLHTREMRIESATRAKDDEYIVKLAMASEQPYERWWGIEILSVDEKSVRLGRLNDGAPVLFNHDWNDIRGVHVPGTVRPDKDRVLRGEVRIQGITERGRETRGLIDGGFLTKASVGYRIHRVIEQSKTKSGDVREREIDGDLFERMIAEHSSTRDRRAFFRALERECPSTFKRSDDDDDMPTYRVVDWEPHENSFVSVPADNSVGVDRAHTVNLSTTTTRIIAMDQAPTAPVAEPRTPAEPNAVDTEKGRIAALENLGKLQNIHEGTVRQWITGGTSVEFATKQALAIQAERDAHTPKTPESELGLSRREVKQYSLLRAVRAAYENDWSHAGHELKCSQEIATKLNKQPGAKTFFVPYEVISDPTRVSARDMRRSLMTSQYRSMYSEAFQRDLTVASGAGGGFLVETSNQGFIDILRNRTVCMRMGATRLTGLVGNVMIPKQTATGSATWLANEASTISEINQTFAQVALAPKTVGGYTEISRLLTLQSDPSAEGIVTSDLAAVVGIAVDLGGLSGSGAGGQPTGITNTAGIGSVTGTSLAFDDILEFQTDVATANVTPSRGGYVTTPAVASFCIQRVKYTSTASPLWEGNIWDGNVQGFPAMSSNQMAAATMLFGDWSQLIIGEWGTLQVDVNPYAGFTAGIIGVRAIYTIDIAVRIPAAFSLATTIT